jgi:CxxC motif-containing protein
MRRRVNKKMAEECEDTGVIDTIRCIVCPTGCEIDVIKEPDGEISFEGYSCPRGLEYAKQEFFAPKRVLTTTIRVKNGFLPLVPVRVDNAILKEKLEDALQEIAVTEVEAPIKMGDILIENIAGEDVNIIASRNLPKAED